MKILFVCTGNICRSPLAEYILKDMCKKENVKIEIESCGISSYHTGEKADYRAIEIAKKHNIDITSHKAKPFLQKYFEEFDLILVMDESHYYHLLMKSDEQYHKKIQYLREFDSQKTSEKDLDVPDPYYDNSFEECFNMIHRSCEEFLLKELKMSNKRV